MLWHKIMCLNRIDMAQFQDNILLDTLHTKFIITALAGAIPFGAALLAHFYTTLHNRNLFFLL